MTEHVLVIYNPSLKSQVQSEEWMGQLVAELNLHGHYLVSFYPTTADTRAQDLVSALEPPLSLVIAAGGDGTIRFALAALALAESPIPAALFPLGTGNVLARNLGIVESDLLVNPLKHVYDYIANGVPMRIDMGMMNGEYFAGMTGVGPLSDAFMLPKREEKSRGKLLAYIKTLLATITIPAKTFKVTTGGKSFKFQASGVFITNVEDLGIGKKPNLGSLNDGYLNMHIVCPAKVKDYIALVKRYGGGCLEDNQADRVIKIKEAIVEVVPRLAIPSSLQRFLNKLKYLFTGKPDLQARRGGEMPCMIDGDAHGATPMRVTIIPAAVTVLVPRQNRPNRPLSAVHDTQVIRNLRAASGQ